MPMWPSVAVAEPYSTGHLFKYSSHSAFWSFCLVENWAEKAFNVIMKDVISVHLQPLNNP